MDICKICRAKQRAADDDRKVHAVIERLTFIGLALLNEGLEPGKSAGCPHGARTFAEILTYFNGSQGFAKHVHAQYLLCKPGSAGRTKIIRTLLGIQMKLREAGHADKPTDKMTDDELKAELE